MANTGGAVGGIGEHLPDLTDEQFVVNGKVLTDLCYGNTSQ